MNRYSEYNLSYLGIAHLIASIHKSYINLGLWVQSHQDIYCNASRLYYYLRQINIIIIGSPTI